MRCVSLCSFSISSISFSVSLIFVFWLLIFRKSIVTFKETLPFLCHLLVYTWKLNGQRSRNISTYPLTHYFSWECCQYPMVIFWGYLKLVFLLPNLLNRSEISLQFLSMLQELEISLKIGRHSLRKYLMLQVGCILKSYNCCKPTPHLAL